MDKSRLEAFSDGVIAVAITLLVIDLHVPEPGGTTSLAHRLAEQWPNYLAYVVSFLTIGVIWINHHAMLARVERVDRSILTLNILLLMSIVILPFSTALMARYVDQSSGQTLAALVYGGSMLLMGTLFVVMQAQLVVHRPHLLRDGITDRARRQILRRDLYGAVPYGIATICALVTPYLTLAICGVLAVYFALPVARLDGDAA